MLNCYSENSGKLIEVKNDPRCQLYIISRMYRATHRNVCRKIYPVLQKNHIPEAVVGGFIVAIVLLIIDKTSGYSFTFDASLQSLLMLTFFSLYRAKF